VADIFRTFGPAYLRDHVLSPSEERVLRAVIACRTAALGGHLDKRPRCGYKHPSYNSCRDRHCPTCQALDQARWIAGRQERILPVHHFHVVFTLPSQLRPLARSNPKLVYDLLFKAVSQTLLTLGQDRLGALLAITTVLHSWTRDMQLHPHLHCLVSAGGLSLDGERWVSSRLDYLFPVEVMQTLFRGKFLDGLKRAYKDGKLVFQGSSTDLADPNAFQAMIDPLFDTRWVVYAKRPFGGSDQVLAYLGQYTHRVAISSYRIADIQGDQITIRTRDERTALLSGDEFIRRFLLHILPKGFRKIRHFGLMASTNVPTRLVKARQILTPDEDLRSNNAEPNDAEPDEEEAAETWEDLLEALVGEHARLCPRCRKARMVRVAEILPLLPDEELGHMDSS
jgi:hypothetical protein